jgi:uncharacterized protein
MMSDASRSLRDDDIDPREVVPISSLTLRRKHRALHGYTQRMAEPSTRLRLRVSPGAGKSGIVGRHGDAWKVRVTAPPEDGRANAAVLRLLADALSVPRKSVTLVSGHTARDKTVLLDGVGPAQIERRLTSATTTDRGRKDRRA